MREIKFRAWMPKESKWYKGGAIQLTAMLGNSFELSEANGKIITSGIWKSSATSTKTPRFSQAQKNRHSFGLIVGKTVGKRKLTATRKCRESPCNQW
jgi:hypothetical protein